MTFLRRVCIAVSVALGTATLAQAALTISPNSMPNGAVGKPYTVLLTANGGSMVTVWSITSGTPPPGVGLSSASGTSVTLAGTPTLPGTYSFTIRAVDPPSQMSDTKQYTIGILQISTPSPLPDGMVLTNYSQTLTASDGTAPYTFSLTLAKGDTFPLGLSLNASGSLTGVPTGSSAGIYTFTVTVSDATGIQTTGQFMLTIVPQLLITTGSPLPSGTVGVAYSRPINASGGTTPYAFSMTGAGPGGLTLSATGVLSGTPSASGTFNFTAKVTDNEQFTATKPFQVTIAAAAPLLQVSPLQLSFTAVAGGNAPPPQTVTIVPSGQSTVNFAIQVDSGAANTRPPAWLTVTPAGGIAPGALIVSVNQTGLTGGGAALPATIHISVPNTSAAIPVITVSVSLTVTNGEPHLQVGPSFLRFAGLIQAPTNTEQVIAVDNSGGNGPLSFTATVVQHSSWIGVTPASGQAAPNSPALVRVGVNTQGLGPGNYHDVVRINTPAGSTDVRVSVFVSTQGAILGLDARGLRFPVLQGNATSLSRTVRVLNLGDSGSTINWTADLLSGSDWLSLGSSRGVALPSRPAGLPLSPNAKAASFPAGGRYALLRVSDPQALNSPQYLVAVLDVEPAGTLPEPQPSPEGLYFTTATGTPAAQSVSIYISNPPPAVAFLAAPFTNDGAAWLTVTKTTPTTSTSVPGVISISVSPTGLTPGIYTGGVNVSIGSVLRTVNVTFVVAPVLSLTTQARPLQAQATTGCTPSRLAITQSGLVSNFSIPAGWPATLIVQVNDDCGNAVTNAAAVASFSNGDPPLSLSGDHQTSAYSATWQPGVVLPEMTISVRATSPTLQTATAQWIGAVNQNPANPPTLVPNGALHIFFNVATAALLGGGLAPGNVAQVYGTGLASTSGSTGAVPLATEFNGTFMLVGSAEAPLFYVSDQLVNVQVPFELTPNRQYATIVSSNGALTLPETIDVVPLQPGMAVFADGSVIAQHLDYSLVTATSPAKPGETLIIYLAGMGSTDPAVASGNPTPLQLVPTKTQPTVTVDSQNASIAYAGLTPTGVGLYQIVFTVPSTAKQGSLDLVVAQGGVSSNTTKLPVAKP